jgi:hypothetical protein
MINLQGIVSIFVAGSTAAVTTIEYDKTDFSNRYPSLTSSPTGLQRIKYFRAHRSLQQLIQTSRQA